MEQLFLTVIVLLSIAITITSPILGGLIILAFLVLWLIPTLAQKIAEIINYVDKE